MTTAVSAGELIRIRVTCREKDCRTTVEVSLSALPAKYDGTGCPVCRRTFVPAIQDRPGDPIREFAESVRRLAGLRDAADVEIVISGDR